MKELFEKQDKGWADILTYQVDKNYDRVVDRKIIKDQTELLISTAISKIREETLQAVREEVEKKKTPHTYKDASGTEYIISMEVKQHNQALDDLLKSLDI